MSATVIHPCGSEKAYQRHWRRREPIDEACRLAHRDAARAYRRTISPNERRKAAARAVATEALLHRHAAEFQTLYRAALAESE